MYSHKVQQTRQQLLAAFIALLNQKDISQISVTDIVTQAQVHRATFYRHFEDKFDLLNQAEQEIFNEIDQAFNQHIRQEPTIKIDTADFSDYRTNLLQIFLKHTDLINALLGRNGDLTFENQLYQKIYSLTQLGFQTLYDLPQQAPQKAEFIGHYAASAAFGITRQWLKAPILSINELSDLLDELTVKGIATALNELKH